jgi:cytochrome c-type biogenesis protein CcmH
MRRTGPTLQALIVAGVFLGAFLGLWPALAVQPDEILRDPALEARARNLSKELRCMVCQNQSIDDSDAPLARDLRILVRERLMAGDSDAAVLDFLTARYGDFVLLKPRLRWDTAALWFAPVVVLAIGAGGLIVLRRRRRAIGEESELTPAEQMKLAELTGRGLPPHPSP